MKKILAVFDGYKLSESTLRYAIEITKQSKSHLTGIFLDAFFYHNYNLNKVLRTSLHPDMTMEELNKQDEQQRGKSAYEFEKACQNAGISFSVHRDHSVPLLELQYESMFADLIVINEREKFTRLDLQEPNDFIKDLLSSLHCPVMVVPDSYKQIDKIVFLYDGEPSSLYAIKMFSYLFSYLQDVPIDVLTIIEKDIIDPQLPGTILMTDFLGLRFSNFRSKLLKGNAEEMIISHLLAGGENQFVVLGAYRRSGFSRWLKPSMADTLMIGLDLPLFIAHD
ncbi:Universal stress protein family protein [compost metagenome]|uniref:universal stress protein n=1 Tax=Pedobacter sp. ok626 TaxID=1761882 RepID=UPI00088C75DE|nr:universal stress protein [Pedobacter sp. ok626]SDJ51899.1 Nucleotide-binding universal stress protein, UspA family [Pedobacter sp. ok626]